MTPENSIENAVGAVGIPCGHWPYTKRADVFCGFKSVGDTFDRASGRRLRVAVRYELVLCHKRGAEDEAERMRFALYEALNRAGWTLVDNGSEVYEEQTEMFYYPMTVSRGFGLDADGQPYDLMHGEVSAP